MRTFRSPFIREAIYHGNSVVIRFVLLLSCSWMACPGQSDEPSDSDQFLKRLAETQNFSLGRPKNAELTADGKTVIFVRALSPQDRSNALYEYNIERRETT